MDNCPKKKTEMRCNSEGQTREARNKGIVDVFQRSERAALTIYSRQ